jgi:hypothetical protein
MHHNNVFVKPATPDCSATPLPGELPHVLPQAAPNPYFRCPCCLHWQPTKTAKTVQPWLVNNSRAIVFCPACFDAFEQLTETDSMILNLHSYLDGAR